MTNPAHEFKESLAEICKLSGIGMCPGCGLTPEGLQNILDTHSAHLVERISSLKLTEREDAARRAKVYNDMSFAHNEAIDQAIDIVKGTQRN